MGDSERGRGRLRWALLGWASFTTGCAEELGPPARETTRVSGVVREGSTAVGGGWIEFLPTLGTVGNMRSAPIDRNGRFEAKGVAVGLNRIGFTGAPIKIPGWRRYFDPLRSEVVRPIPPGRTDNLTIDLYAELARATKSATP